MQARNKLYIALPTILFFSSYYSIQTVIVVGVSSKSSWVATIKKNTFLRSKVRKPICDIVFCPFDFGVLTIYFCMLSSLFVYNVAHFKRRNSRGRAKVENKRGKKDESISILIHPFNLMLVYTYTFEIYAAGNYHSQKAYRRLSI